ncbi:MAG: tRNA guanosine(34) transglycosylase Tgt [Armatimonadetes bacterium]|nr:tRNA guanosine(34) transglycosylase Tgt [Armatimonadota bacterium]MDW8153046.1 tRNA guanosine(34) transglycosylase Tgt [Armatimonadota bacterium]
MHLLRAQPFRFEILAQDGAARAGVLYTPHGPIRTPCFAPVATNAAVRGMTVWDLCSLGADLLLANTFHLYLRPGPELIAQAGGLHAFMGWGGPILTDSGGFQVLSLAHLRRVTDRGVVFRSPIDGSLHELTPERVVEIQEVLGSDIITPLDVCSGYPVDEGEAREALHRTMHWLERSLAARRRTDQALFGILQGAFSPSLRAQAAAHAVRLDLPGYAIGGLSVGEPLSVTYEILECTIRHLPPERPRYLMGVGSPPGIVEAIARGVDLFDCVLPTRVGRTGVVFTRKGRVNLRNSPFCTDLRPLDPECTCRVCARHTRAYVRHLFKSGELLGPILATYHNVAFLLRWVEEARRAILEGTFSAWRERVLAQYATRW